MSIYPAASVPSLSLTYLSSNLNGTEENLVICAVYMMKSFAVVALHLIANIVHILLINSIRLK